jgi:hypothetical protein
MSSQTLRHLLLLAGLVYATAPANATVLLPADLGDLSREARTIARGRVVDVESRWTDDRRRIETLVTLEAGAHLKGPPGATVQFRVPGGRLGRYRSIVIGAPEFAVGQHVIVFLSGGGPAVPHVLGLSQGVFRLVRAGESWVVTPPPVLPVAGGVKRIVRGDPARRPIALADFEREVRTLAGSGP